MSGYNGDMSPSKSFLAEHNTALWRLFTYARDLVTPEDVRAYVPTDPGYDIVSEVESGLVKLRDKPMLIGWGMKDFVFDEHFLREWEARFPKAEVNRFEDCGHYILEDAGDELMPKIRDFLGRT